jgi:hypothetical protein
MGFLVPKAPKIDKTAQKKQEELQEKQEERIATQEAEAAQRTASSLKARQYGGMRQLLSPERLSPEIGLSKSLSGM